MVTITARYDGELHCVATHEASRSTLATDAPKDNHGKGETFSPTDLLATAYGTCILTVMGIAANKLGITIDGAHVRVEKTMSPPPRRIASLPAFITMPAVAVEHRATLENAAHQCPVGKSLHPDIDAPISFAWLAS